MVVRKYREDITTIPFIKLRHIKTLMRKDLGVMVSPTRFRGCLLQMEEKYKKEFLVLNNYVEELKATNFGSTIIVISKKASPGSKAIFYKMYN